ncbi:SDR family oxidoreductase [Echinicola sp. 20G]|uniref:SDR family NAD(P)-dependent oxidoreductase n=1 Tax=Echinicola sp. 20G TaxID=2781961 RepID=UPI0019106EEE|nr:SDR family NAD(P)-dependent oxidoreductase [Echinicola sp. 20G]
MERQSIPKEINGNYALITGACKGIGRAMACECASKGMNMLLVSDDQVALDQLMQDLCQWYEVDSRVFCIDLAKKQAPLKVFEWVMENAFPINVLINNVGIGKSGTFSKMEIKDANYMITLNNRVFTELTYHFLKLLQQQPKAYILNMSSIEATLPLPYKAVYTGTKNFVYAFSLALREELKPTKVSVSVICPGPVLTNADGLGRMNAHGKRSKLLLMMPGQVAKIAIDGMLKGKSVIVPGYLNAFFFWVGSKLPRSIKMPLLEKLFRVYKT